jgi:hypothetical protein
MAASGDYPKVLQSLVDEMVAGGPAAGGKGSLIDHYRDALGCDPEG